MSDELEKPPNCSAGRAPRLQDISADYTGPRLNSSNIIFSTPALKPQQMQGLADLAPEIPKEFSWKNKAGITKPRNQGSCGSCWAFATTSTLADRYAVKFNIEAPVPSVLWTMSCNSPSPGLSRAQQCEGGGNAEIAIQSFADKGVKLESCWPYSILANRGNRSVNCLDKLPEDCCYSCCGEGQEDAKIYLQALPNSLVRLAVQKGASYDVEETIRAIQREIMSKGPVVGNYIVFNDFMRYWNDDAPSGRIYKPNAKSGLNGAHSVVITGWGEKNGQRYWEVRNSWGTQQGDRGYCYMAFSDPDDESNWCGIDVPSPNYVRGQYAGGALSFDIPNEKPGKFNEWTGPEYIVSNINWKLVLGVGAILLVIAILYLILS